MIEANMLEAKTRLSQLVEAAERGEQVLLKRNGAVVAKIVAVPTDDLPFGFLKDGSESIPDELLFGGLEEEADSMERL